MLLVSSKYHLFLVTSNEVSGIYAADDALQLQESIAHQVRRMRYLP
ncbi:hypothetical protein ACJJIX_17645 [Microbulbifer sp. VAAC004]